jgi:hypothetical protein
LKKAIDEQCGQSFETVFRTRLQEADVFYADVIPASLDADTGTSCGRLRPGCSGSGNSFL